MTKSACDTGMSTGDKFKYLGHFGNKDVLAKGHNVGNPNGTPVTGGLGEGGVPGGPTVESPGLMTPKAAPAPAAGLATPSAPKLPAPGRAPGLAMPGTPKPRSVKPVFNATENPIAATKQANRVAIQSAKATGGNVKAVRQTNKANLASAKEARASRNEAGLHKSDAAALRESIGQVRQVRQQMRKTMRGKQVL